MELQLGVEYDLPPIPLDRERTTFFPAGAVSFGVEYRTLDDAVIAANFTAAQREGSAITAVQDGAGVDDRGVSIHVCDPDGGAEYLRFDCFAEEPHYHYIVGGRRNVAILFDTAANGEMLEWTIERLRSHLPAMLERASAESVATEVDVALVGRVLDAVAAEADRVRKVGAA
jgi:hypothetical protein